MGGEEATTGERGRNIDQGNRGRESTGGVEGDQRLTKLGRRRQTGSQALVVARRQAARLSIMRRASEASLFLLGF